MHFFVVCSNCILTLALFPTLKRPEREADHSLLSSAEVRHAQSCMSTPPNIIISWYLINLFVYISHIFVTQLRWIGHPHSILHVPQCKTQMQMSQH